MQSITRFIGHNKKEGRENAHSLKTERQQTGVREEFLHGRLTNSCLTEGTSLPSFLTSPVFHGIFICKIGRALVSGPREVCFFLFSKRML